MLILKVMRKELWLVIKIILLHTLKNIKYIFLAVFYKVASVDDKFSKPVVLYRGKNAINRFMEAIIDLLKKWIIAKKY